MLSHVVGTHMWMISLCEWNTIFPMKLTASLLAGLCRRHMCQHDCKILIWQLWISYFSGVAQGMRCPHWLPSIGTAGAVSCEKFGADTPCLGEQKKMSNGEGVELAVPQGVPPSLPVTLPPATPPPSPQKTCWTWKESEKWHLLSLPVTNTFWIPRVNLRARRLLSPKFKYKESSDFFSCNCWVTRAREEAAWAADPSSMSRNLYSGAPPAVLMWRTLWDLFIVPPQHRRGRPPQMAGETYSPPPPLGLTTLLLSLPPVPHYSPVNYSVSLPGLLH